MEALMSYASDSDSEPEYNIELNNYDNSKETKASESASDSNRNNDDCDPSTVISEFCDKPFGAADDKPRREDAAAEEQCKPDNLTKDREGNSDFFGLFSSEEVENENETVTEVTSKVINVDGAAVGVEIPGSSFWTNTEFGNTDLQTLQNTETIVNSGKRLLSDKSRQSSLVSCSQNVRKRRSHLYVDDKSPLLKNTKHAETFGNTCTNKAVESIKPVNSQQTARKLFYVHQKISPFLHSHKLKNRFPQTQEWTSPAHAGAINRVKWNIPNYSHLLATCSMDSTVKVWNVWTQLDPCLKVLRVHDKAVRDVEWNRDGNQLLTGSFDKSACVSDVETGACVTRLPHVSYVSCVKYHPVRPSVCVTGERDQILAWDLRTPAVPATVFSYKDKLGQVQDVMFDADGSTLFSCSDTVSRDSADRNLMAWDFRAGVVLSNQIYQERYTVTRLKRHPHESQFLAQTSTNYIAIFSLTRPYKLNKHRRYEGHQCQGYNVGFDVSPDGQTVYSGSADGKVSCYHHSSGKLYKTLNIGQDVVTDVMCHPVLTSTVALCTWGGTLQVWK